MKHQLSIIVMLLIIFSNFIQAQDILWTYHLSEETENSSSFFWEDEKGNYTFNIRRVPKRINDSTSVTYNEAFLLKLSSDGIFNGVLHIKACKNRTIIYPFLRNKYLTYGHNCTNVKNRFSYDTRIFNKQGKLVQTGKFKPPFKSLMHLEYDKITSFSKATALFHYGDLYVGYLNKKLNINYDTISIKNLELEGHGATFHMTTPLKIDNKEWVIPIDYGVDGGFGSIKLEFGGFFVTKNNQINWKYTPNKKYYYFGAFSNYNDNIIAILKSSNRRIQFIKYFNKDGELIDEYQLQVPGTNLQSIQILDTTIVTLSKHHYNKTHYISYYNIQGELSKTIELPKTFTASDFKLMSNKSIIVVGSKNKRTFIMKIGEENNKTDEKELSQSIQYSTLEESSTKISSVNLFPNPTSDILNIQINHDKNITQKQCTVQIFDIKGSKIREEFTQIEKIQLNLTDLNSGTYFYTIIIDNLEYLTGKFIKI